MNFSLVTSSFLWFCCLSDHASSSMTAWASKPRYSGKHGPQLNLSFTWGSSKGHDALQFLLMASPPSPEAGPIEIYAPLPPTHVCLGSDEVKSQFPDGFLIHISKQNTGQTDIFLKMRAFGV